MPLPREHRATFKKCADAQLETDCAPDGSWINVQLRPDGRLTVECDAGGSEPSTTTVLSRKSVAMLRELLG